MPGSRPSSAEALRDFDLIAITGDVVTKGWEQSAVELWLRALPSARLGRCPALGNGSTGPGPAPRSGDRSWRVPVTLLHQWVGRRRLRLVGTEDSWLGPPISRLVRDWSRVLPWCSVTPQRHLISDVLLELMLSGHAHGGQVLLPLLGAIFVPLGSGPIRGWYQQAERRLFVSRGLGWSVAPVRVGADPEIAVLERCLVRAQVARGSSRISQRIPSCRSLVSSPLPSALAGSAPRRQVRSLSPSARAMAQAAIRPWSGYPRRPG